MHPHRHALFGALGPEPLRRERSRPWLMQRAPSATVAAEDNPFRLMEGMMSEADRTRSQGLREDARLCKRADLPGRLRLAGSSGAWSGLRADPTPTSSARGTTSPAKSRLSSSRPTWSATSTKGTLMDAVLRAALYVAACGPWRRRARLRHAEGDWREDSEAHEDRAMRRFKAALRKQFLTLRLDEERAMARRFPRSLPADEAARARGLEALKALFDSRDRTPEKRAHRRGDHAVRQAGRILASRKPAAQDCGGMA